MVNDDRDDQYEEDSSSKSGDAQPADESGAFELAPVNEMELEAPVELEGVATERVSVEEARFANALKPLSDDPFVRDYEVLPSAKWLKQLGFALGLWGSAIQICTVMPLVVILIAICGGAFFAARSGGQGELVFSLFLLIMVFTYTCLVWFRIYSGAKKLWDQPMALTSLVTGRQLDVADYISWGNLHAKLPMLTCRLIQVGAILLFVTFLSPLLFVFGADDWHLSFVIVLQIMNLVYDLLLVCGLFLGMAMPVFYLLACFKMMKFSGLRIMIFIWLTLIAFLFISSGITYLLLVIFIRVYRITSPGDIFEMLAQNTLGKVTLCALGVAMLLGLLNWVWMLVMGYTFRKCGQEIEESAMKVSRVRLRLRQAGCEWDL